MTGNEERLEAEFWVAIRKDIVSCAELECSEVFCKMITERVNTMGPAQLKKLYVQVYLK